MSLKSIGKLVVNLGWDDRKMRSGVKSSERLIQKFGRGLSLAGAAAGAAAIGGLTLFTKQSFAAIDAQAKLARDLQTTTESMQVMERAGELAGVGMSGIEQATKDLTRRLSQAADGTGPAVAALGRLGISAQELMALPLDVRVATINSRLDDFVPAASRAAVAGQLFGEEGSIAMARLDSAVLRQATEDVERFGVAVTDVDAAQIERTNDAISRMALIGQGLGNQIAVAVAPALERMADGLASIAQVGGPLNTAITLVLGNMDRLAAYAATAATLIGVQYVSALALAAVRTFTLAGAMRVLRAAIIRTGFGVLIIGAVELGMWFGRLVEKAGGFGNALGLLKNVAIEVFDKMKAAFALVPAAINVGSSSMRSYFLGSLKDMLQGFQDLTWSVAQGLNSLFGTNLEGAVIGAISDGPLGGSPLERMIRDADAAASAAQSGMDSLLASVNAPLQSLGALRTAMQDAATDTDTMTVTLDGLGGNLDDIGGGAGGGGGSAAAAAAGVAEIGVAAEQTEDRLSGLKTSFGSFFESMTTRSATLSDALGNLLVDFSRMASSRAFNLIWSGGAAGGGLSGLITSALPGFANGTMNAPGGLAVVNERGGEIRELANGTKIYPNDLSQQMINRGNDGQKVHVTVGFDVASNGNIAPFVVDVAAGMAARSADAIQRGLGGSMSAVAERTR